MGPVRLRCKKCGGRGLRFDTLAQGTTTDGQWPKIWQLDSPENTLITCETCGHEGDWIEFYQPEFIFSHPEFPDVPENAS